MDLLYKNIKAHAEEMNEYNFIQMYNGQPELMGDKEGAQMYSFPMPALLIEFDDDIEFKQLGAGVQIADPFFVTLHILTEKMNDADGNQELNLEVYQLKDRTFKKFNKFEPLGAVAFIRTSETQDKNHTNVYHYKQKYKTNYIQTTRIEPVDGITKDPTTDLDLTVQIA